ncbi:AMP-dependent synthetase [Hylemonella gracilis str. Niagara R]|uniref:AMP-dependent synthetase n=1 Tax=Hylemonella gracilis str. Niagara R TaxID=1458275 RepID=A0A016XGF2_9BURK|nr:AMP-binding protein [Hylemonella gracilis]EYC51164.1 AMP-dependent synthetase [Hylemonella gracilis str. Niagara R]
MRRLLLLLLALLTCAYPLLIYISLGHVAPHWLALLLTAMALLRAAATRERHWLMAALGALLLAGATAASGNFLPLKFYPVLVNAVLLFVFTWSLRHPPSVIERLARLTEPALPPAGVAYTRGLTQVWCGFFIVNGLLALVTALWPQQAHGDELWALYNGLIAYLLMGSLFAGEWLLRPRLRRRFEARHAAAAAHATASDAPQTQPSDTPYWRPLTEVATRSSDADFLRRVQAWRAAFAAQASPAVILYFTDSRRFSCALYGAWHAGKTVYLPGDAQAATLRSLDTLHAQDGPPPCRAGDLPGAMPEPRVSTEGDTPSPLPPLTPLDARTTQLIVHTSGSSGQPQAIPKQLAQLDAEVHTLQATFGARVAADATLYTTVSHQHIYGLLFIVLWPLALTGRAPRCHRIDYPEELAEQLRRQASGRAILVSSPAHLKRLPASSPGGLDWRGARTALSAIFSSGGPLPPEAAEAALDLLGRSPIEVYGSSETGGIAWRQRAVHGERWLPFQAVAWRIGPDELLAVCSPNLPDAQWFQTADRAQALPESAGGGFLLQGRADRIVKIEEKRVSLNALEATLLATGLVKEARALVLDGAGDHARPRLAVVAVPSDAGWALHDGQGKRNLNETLRAALLQAVERVALPRRWRYLRELPQNAQGKTTQADLAALFSDHGAEAQPGITAPTVAPSPAQGPALPPWRLLPNDAPAPAAEPAQATIALLALDIRADLAAFDGHFDGLPILPGVAQIDWAARLGRTCFAQALNTAQLADHFSRIEVLKFQQPVLPGMQVQLRLQLLTRPEGGQALEFSYHGTQGGQPVVHSSGRLVYAPTGSTA